MPKPRRGWVGVREEERGYSPLLSGGGVRASTEKIFDLLLPLCAFLKHSDTFWARFHPPWADLEQAALARQS